MRSTWIYLPETLAEREDGCLARQVGSTVRQVRVGHHAARVHDATAVLGDVLQKRVNDVHSAEVVHSHHGLVVIVVYEVRGQCRPGHTCIVYDAP